MRQIVLDTETTGLDPSQGHRIIEIGCVELVNRRPTGETFHQYIQPDREIDEGAVSVHGITTEFLADKPRFRDVAEAFLRFVVGAELVIHNAPFDIGFINAELERLPEVDGPVETRCGLLDTLALARKKHPGRKNNLDALCKRYDIDNSNRDLHGALLDARILADVYLAMTGGQASLALAGEAGLDTTEGEGPRPVSRERPALRVLRATEAERAAHEARLRNIADASGGNCLWMALESRDEAPTDRPDG
ncbi:MAG: DNA polymerase III subunit epsilon [Gammaproteobacteria bacterium]|jgi:DNA polymerase-3 subunit epsilon|nr:DNA polymerase III subunit epsilon [Gammaproteobacteria bacterium]